MKVDCFTLTSLHLLSHCCFYSKPILSGIIKSILCHYYQNYNPYGAVSCTSYRHHNTPARAQENTDCSIHNVHQRSLLYSYALLHWHVRLSVASTHLPVIQGHGGRNRLRKPIIFHPRTQHTNTQISIFWKTDTTKLAFHGVTSCSTYSLLVYLRRIVSNDCTSN